MTSVDKKENIKHSKLRQLQVFQKVEYGGGPIFKVVLECEKVNLFLSISAAYNLISCRKVSENTQKSKLRPGGFLEHRPIFAGNSRSTDISQLRVGKTYNM